MSDARTSTGKSNLEYEPTTERISGHEDGRSKHQNTPESIVNKSLARRRYINKYSANNSAHHSMQENMPNPESKTVQIKHEYFIQTTKVQYVTQSWNNLHQYPFKPCSCGKEERPRFLLQDHINPARTPIHNTKKTRTQCIKGSWVNLHIYHVSHAVVEKKKDQGSYCKTLISQHENLIL